MVNIVIAELARKFSRTACCPLPGITDSIRRANCEDCRRRAQFTVRITKGSLALRSRGEGANGARGGRCDRSHVESCDSAVKMKSSWEVTPGRSGSRAMGPPW